MKKTVLKVGAGIAKLTGMVTDPQKQLDNQYPDTASRVKVKKLTIEGKDEEGIQLVGSLSLKGFFNLEELYAPDLGITDLDLTDCSKLKIFNCSLSGLKMTNCPDLEEFICSIGFLRSLNFLTKFNLQKLRKLVVSRHDFARNDLTLFSQFVNLEVLDIDAGDLIFRLNRFYGSLEPLQSLTKLKELNISGTDIETGLECLPNSLEYFACSPRGRENAKVRKIEKELKFYGEPKGNNFIDSLELWKTDYQEQNKSTKVLKTTQNQNLESQEQQTLPKPYLKKELTELHSFLNNKERKPKRLREEYEELMKLFIAKLEEISQLQAEITEKNQNIRIFRDSNQLLVAKLEKDLVRLQDQLNAKEQELTELRKKCEELTKKLSLYLELIGDYYQKQNEAQEIKFKMKQKGIFDEKLTDEFSKVQKGVGKLEEKIETIIQEQGLTKGDLLQNLKLRNETWDQITAELGAQFKQYLTIEEFKEWLEEKLAKINILSAVNINNIQTLNTQVGAVIMDSNVTNQAEKIYFGSNTITSENWTNIHPSFINQSLINHWQSSHFTYHQTQEWANTFGNNFNPHDYAFVVWLRDTKQLTVEQALNSADLGVLRSEYQQQELKSNIEIPPKS